LKQERQLVYNRNTEER